jgi:predicted dehydrogenase
MANLRVGIVGCGKIADSHAAQIQRVAGCEIVGACDREELMARQLCERFEISHAAGDVRQMLEQCRPDVVHITTPPQTHYEIARMCLEFGSHVYVEKPFTIRADETEALLDLASKKELKMTAGHDDQFSHVARQMRALVRAGYLGKRPVHLESHYCYDLTDPAYARVLLADQGHWVRKLPGKLLHNIISHGIARIAEFLSGERPTVIAHGFVSPFLRSLGENQIIDELRVIVRDQDDTTAYFTFSSQMHPGLHQFKVYGQKNGLMLDEDQQVLIRLKGTRYKSYVEKFLPSLVLAGEYAGNCVRNARRFLARDFHMKSGMKYLIEAFYGSILRGEPLPIEYREILRVSRIMDDIFQQLGQSAPDKNRAGA